jgi:early secretory antigenic target protein ESAT-6
MTVPTGDGTQLTFNFGSVEGAALQLKATAMALNHELEQLDADLRPLITNWDGVTQAEYYQQQQQWDNAMLDIIDLLNHIGFKVDAAVTEFWKTEQLNASLWLSAHPGGAGIAHV